MKTSHYFIPIRLAKVKNMAVPCLDWNVEKWTLSYYTFGGSINYSTLKSNLVDVKLKAYVPSGNSYTSSQGTGTKMVFVALFILTNSWK